VRKKNTTRKRIFCEILSGGKGREKGEEGRLVTSDRIKKWQKQNKNKEKKKKKRATFSGLRD